MRDWSGLKVVILGAARQGTALARYLAGKGARVVVSDQRPADALADVVRSQADLPVEWALGGHPLALLDGADLVCPSGGVPLSLPFIQSARRAGIPLSNDSQIFLEAAPCTVIGITGSAGKTTTTTLVGRMAQAAAAPGQRVWVGGNIGTPLVAFVDEMHPQDIAVVEFSSFQLEIMTRSPQVAAVLNITPNHLDRHGTMAAYTAAKAHILAHQSTADVAVLNRDDPGSWSLRSQVQGRLLSFGTQDATQDGMLLHNGELVFLQDGRETPVMSAGEIRLRGQHNLQNVLAACTIAAAAGLPAQAMQAGVHDFEGVAHRLEFVRTWGSADWYNDSIATAPERAMAAIRSFDEPLVLLAGGRDKDLPWGEFGSLVRRRVARLIVFGEAAEKIIQAVGGEVPTQRCRNLEEAVQAAASLVRPGDVVLLSPGGTSFDEFRDFEERGECFRQLVMRL